MKLLWLCNMVPSVIREKMGLRAGSGLWVDHVLKDLRNREDLMLHVLGLSDSFADGILDERCSYGTFSAGAPYKYLPGLEAHFRNELKRFCPDVIHIWGTEYAHTLAMVNAAEQEGMLARVVISIQGLCSVYTDHYAEGLPPALVNAFTPRDLFRWDTISLQRKKYAQRGAHEIAALKKVVHVIGRTDWDKACAEQINPEITYHKCNETLRPVFYSGNWDYAGCQKHRVFASSCSYPVKGFHYLLKAMAQVRKQYPDATLAVPGRAPCSGGVRHKLLVNAYELYLYHLIRRYELQDSVVFLGNLSAEEMKANYLCANVFALPSTIENSPNSLGEAMLLGVPCVSSDVGGVTTMMTHNKEGYVYQSTAPYMLAYYIRQVFAMEDKAASMGQQARSHAAKTHDPENNLRDLLDIYREIAGKE